MKKYSFLSFSALLFVCNVFIACGKMHNEEINRSSDMATLEVSPAMDKNQPASLIETEIFSPAEAKKSDEDVKPNSGIEAKNIQQLIKNASIQIEVENIEKSKKEIDALIKNAGGYTSNENQSNNYYEINDVLTLRLPVANFDKTITTILKQAIYVTNKTITAQDVTAEYYDIQIRLKTKKEVENRYIELLKKAQKVQDIMDVEEHLRIIREEIESSEGQLKLMKDQIAYSTITLTLTQKLDYKPAPQRGFLSRITESTGQGWRALQSFILGIFSFWPFVIIIVLLLLFIKKIKKAKK